MTIMVINKLNMFRLIPRLTLLILFSFLTLNCGGFSKTDARKTPINAMERAKKNVAEGRGAGLNNILRRGSTSYEFSSSNPLWRASLEILDFLPLNTVDYSGGVIVSDWYSNSSSSKESIKVSIRFLSNEVRSDSVKIIVHKKDCSTSQSCTTSLLADSKIVNELRKSILAKAVIFQREDKNKKKK